MLDKWGSTVFAILTPVCPEKFAHFQTLICNPARAEKSLLEVLVIVINYGDPNSHLTLLIGISVRTKHSPPPLTLCTL